MSRIELKHIDKFYGSNHVLRDINLTIEDGDFMTLLGPSGCGKTTTLRVVSGLEKPQNGTMTIDGVEMINADDAYYAEPSKRGLNLVFQSYALWPHMTVYDNIAFGLKIQKMSKAEIDRRVMDSLRMMRIDMYKDRYPTELSGGQQQRVAIARAVASSPKLLLLDEPLSNLDAKLRAQMRTELSKLHKKLGTTFIYVTHDQTEAMTMGDRIVVMKDGYIQQIDSPINLYENPVNKFVAGFIGSPQMNFIPAKLIMANGKYTVEFGSEDTKTSRGRKFYVELPSAKADNEGLKYYVDKEVILGIRPENIHDEEMFLSTAKTGMIEATVDVTEMLGAETFLYLTCEGIPLTARVSPRCTARPQDTVKLALDPNKIHLFDASDEHSLLN